MLESVIYLLTKNSYSGTTFEKEVTKEIVLKGYAYDTFFTRDTQQ